MVFFSFVQVEVDHEAAQGFGPHVVSMLSRQVCFESCYHSLHNFPTGSKFSVHLANYFWPEANLLCAT